MDVLPAIPDVLCWDTSKAVERLEALGYTVTVHLTCAPRANGLGTAQFVVRQSCSSGECILIVASKQQLPLADGY